MMRRFSRSELDNWLIQRHSSETDVGSVVRSIIDQVRRDGSKALRDLTAGFDGVSINDFAVPQTMIDQAASELDPNLRRALLDSTENLRRFHSQQKPDGYKLTQPDGTQVSWNWRPVRRAGLYVPGGRYPLVSTLLMNVIPAQLAGVKDIVVCTPPSANDWPSPTILAACELLGITKVFRVGGAQSIAAMAMGTDDIPAVDIITGPGNKYVTEAKFQLSRQVGIDMIAGPTEVVVAADKNAPPAAVVAELLSQAEHDPDALPILIVSDEKLIEPIEQELAVQLADLPTKDIAIQSLQNNAFIYIANDLNDMVTTINAIAPEHLSLQVTEARELSSRLIAGTTFIGSSTPVAWGDFWAGSNHTLPTSGQARFRGPLSVYDFLVPFATVEAGPDALSRSGRSVAAIGRAEGLEAHARSVEVTNE